MSFNRLTVKKLDLIHSSTELLQWTLLHFNEPRLCAHHGLDKKNMTKKCEINCRCSLRLQKALKTTAEIDTKKDFFKKYK